MTNFDFLLEEKELSKIAKVAIDAEKIAAISCRQSIMAARSAAEFAVKWFYAYNPRGLIMPTKATFAELLNNTDFKKLVHEDNFTRLTFIKQLGNKYTHNESLEPNIEHVRIVLEQLFYFLDYLCYLCNKDHKSPKFNPGIIGKTHEYKLVSFDDITKEKDRLEKELAKLRNSNTDLQKQIEELAAKRSEEISSKPIDFSEADTRKLFIDAALDAVGWEIGSFNLQVEVKVEGMPNAKNEGYIDYVMFGDDGVPLAIIEAKKTSTDVSKGRQQAKLYADALEKKYHRRPVIFLTNGYEIKINDGIYPERRVFDFYSKQDLEKWFNLQTIRKNSDLTIKINTKIVDRAYQKIAITKVCEEFIDKHKRKALLVMATGSGKTRTIVELCDVLFKKSWIHRVLFLADRNVLVKQAQRSFVEHLSNAITVNLCDTQIDNIISANYVFSTYQTMINRVDSFTTVGNKKIPLFTSGYFDLIICDEAHRSIYRKYKSIFNHFDGLLVGLTATPREDIDKNTYAIFNLENGEPTYEYSLKSAVEDGYLVNFKLVRTKLKFLEMGIYYSDLTNDEKLEYDDLFLDAESGKRPDKIEENKINTVVFNEDTIKKVLDLLMTKGIKINFREKIGKTIIFAKNHKHAEKILEVFNNQYPHLPGYAQVIDNQINYVQSLIDDFSDDNKLPQIAISVDMLDTGIDVPSILNLVFFKNVFSKTKFWQMIGRGTRKCPGLIDGKDKSEFYIFDICSNFDFFEMKPEGIDPPIGISLQNSLFKIKLHLAHELQKDIYDQNETLQDFRKWLVSELVAKCEELKKFNNFEVRQHLKWVIFGCDSKNYASLTQDDVQALDKEVAPIVLPDQANIKILRFDLLLFGIELAKFTSQNCNKSLRDLDIKLKSLKELATTASIQDIKEKKEFIDRVRAKSFIENANPMDFEHIRTQLRELMVYLGPKEAHTYLTHFEDEFLGETWETGDLSPTETENYKSKVKDFINNNSDHPLLRKIKNNIPLTPEDIKGLQDIFWNKLGDKATYDEEIGNQDLGLFIRSIVGLDRAVAKQAFSKFLNGDVLNSVQMEFLDLIIDYIVKNGYVESFNILQEAPFDQVGKVSEIYENNLDKFKEIRNVIVEFKNNANTESILNQNGIF